MPNENHFSLENDFFPKIIQKKCAGFIIDSDLIDIGTPERYQMAINIIRERR
jgi:NDP-sugar pyrophosphorylase family protein